MSPLQPELHALLTNIFDPCNLKYTTPVPEPESADYAAHTFQLNGKFVKFRIAKITPTKMGQFVTIWKRNGKGPIIPFDLSDELDLVIIGVRKEEQLGHFIFPKSVLNDHGIVSGHGKTGKRGIRVYPPWDQVNSKQAQKTQAWQQHYFLAIGTGKQTDLIRAKILPGEK